MSVKCPKCHSENSDTQSYCGDCGTQLIPSKDIPSQTKTLETPIHMLSIATVFAERYEILEKLGKGGMGEVYRVKDRTLDEEMALKVLRPEIAAHEETIERFKNELKLARKIAHRNVCKMYDLHVVEETPFITMEFVQGENLKNLIKGKTKLSEKEAIVLARQICEGLVEAHELEVIHRDLKPQNIMIDDKGTAKVMDFGIARSLEAAGVTQTGIMIGTPDYISPEQVDGEDADHRSDIYSLGVILYEMVTGDVPFKGDTGLSVALKHRSKLPLDPRKIDPDVSDNLSRLILICMEKDRERRYPSVKELLADLKNIEEGFPLGSKIRPRRETFAGSLIRKKLFFPALASLLVVIIAAMSIFIWRSGPSFLSMRSRRISLAVMYLTNNTGDSSLDYLRRAFTELVIADLLQSQHIRVLTSDRLNAILRDSELLGTVEYSSGDLRKIASLGRVDHILQGSITKAGETFRINAFLHDASTLEPMASEQVEGRGLDSIFHMIDSLTRKIKADFDLTAEEIAADIDKDVQEITTASHEALKHYIEGKSLAEEGEFERSIDALEKATSIDPEFALAYWLISDCYNYMGDVDQSEENLEKAFSFINKVSDREYYLLQGYASSTTEGAIENYKKLLDLYPDDVDGNSLLAAHYRNNEAWDLALQRYEKLANIVSDDELIYDNIAHILMAKGQYSQARKILESRLDTFSQSAIIHKRIGNIYFFEGKYDLALKEVKKSVELKPDDALTRELLGNIYQIKGDTEAAAKIYDELKDSEDFFAQYTGRFWLCYLYLTQGQYGKFQEAVAEGERFTQEFNFSPGQYNFTSMMAYHKWQKKQFTEALDEAHQAFGLAYYRDHNNFSLHLRGMIYAQMNRIEEAKDTADQLKHLIEKNGVTKFMRHHYHLMGRIYKAEGNLGAAIREFEKAISLLPQEYFKADMHILYFESLAAVYLESGDWKKAQKVYKKITDLKTGRLRWGDLYVKSFYMLAKIYEDHGDTANAIEHYEKFLDLWKDADSGIAEVEDSKERLEVLKTS